MKFHWTVLIVSHQDCRIKKLKVTPLTITLAVSICAVLAIVLGYAGYRLHALRPPPLRVALAKTYTREQAVQIARLSSEVARLDKEMNILREYNRHVSRLSKITLDKAHTMNGMGGGGGRCDEKDRPAASIAEKMLSREISDHVRRLGIDITIEQRVAQELCAELERQQSIASHTPCMCPTHGWFTSLYGWRDSPFSGEREFHTGIDIASFDNAPIFAPADGTVTAYYKSETYGNVMEINHGHGIETRYGHLSRPAVKVGKKVKKGNKIGYVGNSGQSTGTHLHYEIIMNGSHVNPQRYMLK